MMPLPAHQQNACPLAADSPGFPGRGASPLRERTYQPGDGPNQAPHRCKMQRGRGARCPRNPLFRTAAQQPRSPRRHTSVSLLHRASCVQSGVVFTVSVSEPPPCPSLPTCPRSPPRWRL